MTGREPEKTPQTFADENTEAVKTVENSDKPNTLGGKIRAAAAAMLEKGKKAGKAAGAVAEAGWEKAGYATGEGWDKAGKLLGKLRSAVAKHPISPLLYVTILAVFIGYSAFNGMYTRAYVLNVDGVEVGLLENEEELDTIVENIESRVSGILGEDYSYDADITLIPAYAAVDSFSDADEVENMLFEGVGAYMEAYAISVDGVELGCAPDKNILYGMLDELAQPYLTEDAVSYGFVENVQIYPVQVPANATFDVDSIWKDLSTVEVEQAYYTVERGDTFNAIAYAHDMMPYELSALNSDIEVNKLWVGQQLLIRQAVPYLSVVAVADETYEEVVKSPIEYIETADLYVGNTSVKEQGSDGLALVNAKATYINGVETEREIITSDTLVEATTTYMYTGTTPRPATASNGYYIWPVRGTITSYFGYRWIGYSDYHLGLDIGVPYGTTVKAADGGKVTFAGWKGSYGYLVIITHDNGQQTYYAHNSSLLVSAGQRVYQGQAIAKVGATGNASGPHCHFEIRINGTVVNPLKYL